MEEDGPSSENNDVSVQRGAVFKKQSSRRKLFDGPVTFQFDLPVNDELRSTDILNHGTDLLARAVK